MSNLTKRDKVAFAKLLRDAFDWLVNVNKLPHGRHEAALASLCGTSVKNVRRWRDGSNVPKRDSWETAKAGLSQAGLPKATVEHLDLVWLEVTTIAIPASRLPTANAAPVRLYSIIPYNPFPKLCFINLDIPEQGSSCDDFIAIGELRFARAPDQVDTESVTVGVRRAVLLPVAENCVVKLGSLHRPNISGSTGNKSAGQVVFEAVGDERAVLEGDQLKGEAFARFIAMDESSSDPPSVEVLVQLETAADLHVALQGDLQGRSVTQRKLAERWIAQQLARTIREPDGSLRLGGCTLRWKSKV